MVATWTEGSANPPERFHRRLIEALDFTDAELTALTGEAPEAEPTTETVETPELAEEPRARTEPESDPVPKPEPVPTSEPGPPPPRAAEPPAPRRRTMSAGRAIQEARRRKGWTTRELASAIHYRKSEVDSWEDDATVPWKFAVRAMADVLEFTDDEAAAVQDTVDDS